MSARGNWGWLAGIVIAAALTMGVHNIISPPISRYTIPPTWPPEFGRGDFDRSRHGLPSSLGHVELGISGASMIEHLHGWMHYNARPIPTGERWDLMADALQASRIWRIQLSAERRVVAIAGGWWLMSDGLGAVNSATDDVDLRSGERTLSRVYGPPDSVDDFGIGRVLTWDRLPAVIMQVHVDSGMAVISTIRHHRLFADE